MNLTIEGFKNLRATGASSGLGERAASVALAAGREPGIKLDTLDDGEQTGPTRARDRSELRLQSGSSLAG